MTEKAQNVLSLNHEEAMDFFLKSEQYHGFELPKYFVFDKLLQNVRDAVGETPYEVCLQDGASPEQLPDVNLDILLNKDGHYAVRPIVLANPYLYYFLVRELCNEQAWATVKQLFEKFNVPHIASCALPVLPKEEEAFSKSTTILNWWSSMEQRSIELSLEYRYMFVTDITNCYGSVNPQAFDWAFSLKGTEHEQPAESPIAQNIQKYLRAFQQGRNIGIPQGSALFDFAAEFILGYSDLLLHEALQREGVKAPYEIIRYRDDYRIFCNDKDELEKISYILQHVLESLNFRMNSKKTMISESIVTDAIKSDKLAYLYNTPIFNKKGCDFDSFEKHLLYILMFARKYPNSGSIKTMLADLDKRIEKRLKYLARKAESDVIESKTKTNDASGKSDDSKKSENIFDKQKVYKPNYQLPGGTVRAMAAICTQIALENVGSCHYALMVLSRIVDSLTDKAEKSDIINLVRYKLISQPNSAYTQLWLQNITYKQDKENGTSPYDMRLCRIAAGDKDVELWNNKWVKPKYVSGLQTSSIVDADTLKDITPVITFRRRRTYDEQEANVVCTL